MLDTPSNFILLATLGAISLSAPMLIARAKVSQAYVMLSLFILFSAIANSLPLVSAYAPIIRPYTLAIVLPAYILQPIYLWFYVQGLCSPTRWQFSNIRKSHFILPVVALVYSIAVVCLPANEMMIILEGKKEVETSFATAIIVATFLLMVVWMVQSTVYMVFIVRRLLSYKQELKQLFASNDKVELTWLLIVVGAIALAWCVSLAFLILSFNGSESKLNSTVVEVIYFMLIWILSFWGLRQKPGFYNRYIETSEAIIIEPTEIENDAALFAVIEATRSNKITKKYARSGLDEKRCTVIADKIEAVMRVKQLYLDANLSLGVLATELAIKPNYVSQALNQILGSTFFDYINCLRVNHSKILITSSKASILDIALESGFYAKSSFYKAFKKETGQTPVQFRESSRTSLSES